MGNKLLQTWPNKSLLGHVWSRIHPWNGWIRIMLYCDVTFCTLYGRTNTFNIPARDLFRSRGSTFNPKEGRNVPLSYCGKHLSNYLFHFWECQNKKHCHDNLIVQLNSFDIFTHYFSTYCPQWLSPNLHLDRKLSRLRFCKIFFSAVCNVCWTSLSFIWFL